MTHVMPAFFALPEIQAVFLRMKGKKAQTLSQGRDPRESETRSERTLDTGIHNTSEIGRLRKVMLHRPGGELENLMPEYL